MFTKSFFTWVILGILLLTGLTLRIQGIAGPSLHPDEPTIGRWVAIAADHGEIRDRLYPGGFFVLATPVRRVCRAIQTWRAGVAYRTGETDRLATPWDDIRFTRLLNVALSLLACLAVYAFAQQISGSRVAALAALAYCVFDPILIEHSHYAETDVAMLLMLTLTLLMWARALYTGRALFILAGALVAGFAAGTKFTLVFLLLPLLVVPFVSRDSDSYHRSLGRTFYLAALSLLLFAAGFVWTNPSITRPAAFAASLAKQSQGLLSEMSTALGGAAQTPTEIAVWKLRLLGAQAGDMGGVFCLLAIAGALLLFCVPRFRKSWPLLILVPLLLLAVHLFASPFIRKQEFLAYLPLLAVLAALPLAVPPPANRAGRILLRTGVLLLVLVSLTQWNLEARRVSGLFGWKDPRIMARDWNVRHAPSNKTVAIERGARPASEGSFGGTVSLYKIEDIREGFGLLARLPADYLLRDSFAKGRGFNDPFSGRLRPRYERVWTNFVAHSEALYSWSPFPFARANASHAGHGVLLYRLQPKPAKMSLNVHLADPVFISEAGRETAFPSDGLLGGREAVRLTELPRELAVGGPGPGVNHIGVTLHTEQREADIRLRAWGRTTRVAIPPWSVRTVTLSKPWWWRVPEPYARVRAWSAPLKSLDSPPCWLRLGQRQVVITGYTLGNAALSLRHLSERDLDSPLDLFRFAVRAEDWTLAAEAQSQARVAWDTLERALRLPDDALSVNGVEGSAYNDFARIRDLDVTTHEVVLASDHVRKRDTTFLRDLKEWRLRHMGREPLRTCLSASPFMPPFRLAQGRYRLELDIRPLQTDIPDEAEVPDADRYELVDSRGHTLAKGQWSELDPNRDTPVSLELVAGRDEGPLIHLVTPVPRTLAIRRAELNWTLHERLQAVHQDLAACFARFALEQAAPAEALEWLDRAGPEPWNAGELENLRRQAKGQTSIPAETAFRFTPFYRLANIRLNPDGRTLKVTLTALQEDTPPHELQVVRRKGRTWKTVAAAPLHPKRFLAKGESVTTTLPVTGQKAMQLGLRIRTDILTQPGSLSIDESEETVLPLSQVQMFSLGAGQTTAPQSRERE